MKGIIIQDNGDKRALILGEMNAPVLEAGDLLIEVRAAGVNRTDIIKKQQGSNYATYDGLGVEIAGVVAQIDGDNRGFSVGDWVMGLVDGGGYAEYAKLPADRAMHIPEGLSFEEAAAIPEVFLTAYQNLFWNGKLGEKETVLIHAGGSGVGTAAIQLARQLVDAKIFTTAGSKEKLEVCHNLGADVMINYKEQEFDTEVLEATNQHGAEVILDFIGASYWEKNNRSIAESGRWVLIGMLGGHEVSNVNLLDLMKKYVEITGTLLTPRSAAYKAKLAQEFTDQVLPLFVEGRLKPIVDTIFPLEEAEEAQAYMEANRNIGKIILKVK